MYISFEPNLFQLICLFVECACWPWAEGILKWVSDGIFLRISGCTIPPREIFVINKMTQTAALKKFFSTCAGVLRRTLTPTPTSHQVLRFYGACTTKIMGWGVPNGTLVHWRQFGWANKSIDNFQGPSDRKSKQRIWWGSLGEIPPEKSAKCRKNGALERNCAKFVCGIPTSIRSDSTPEIHPF